MQFVSWLTSLLLVVLQPGFDKGDHVSFYWLQLFKCLTGRYLNKDMKAPWELLKLAYLFYSFLKYCFIVLSQRMALKRDYSVLWQNHYVILNSYTLFKYLISSPIMKKINFFVKWIRPLFLNLLLLWAGNF